MCEPTTGLRANVPTCRICVGSTALPPPTASHFASSPQSFSLFSNRLIHRLFVVRTALAASWLARLAPAGGTGRGRKISLPPQRSHRTRATRQTVKEQHGCYEGACGMICIVRGGGDHPSVWWMGGHNNSWLCESW